MADNKFIKHLRGENTTGSLVEIKNQNTPASFANMPQGTSNPNVVYSDHRGNVTVAAKGTQNWKLNDASLTLSPNVAGDGTDYTGEFNASGAGLWINSVYTFPTTGDVNHPVAAIFNAGTKWVLKLCGHGLLSDNKTINFTLLIKFGSSTIITKNFTVSEKALEFCEEFVIDYSESIQTLIKAQGGSKLTLQLLCSDPTASATIYNGMSVLTVLQRGVDAEAVSASFANVEEVMRDGLLPNDFFNNAEYMQDITEGGTAFPMFIRRGDEMVFSGWRDNKYKKYIFVLSAGQTVLQFGEDIEDQNIDLYWNGQFISQQGNWTVSGDEITMSFGPEENDVIVVITNAVTEVVDYVTLASHNTDPNAHANIVYVLNNSINAVDARIDTANIDCGTL